MPEPVLTERPATEARIGPNALIQTVAAMRESLSEAQVAAVLDRCNQEHLLRESVTGMVAEQSFAGLVAALADQLGIERAHQILQRAGQRTADYLLAHRIPGLFQRLLGILPGRMALKLLLAAIGRHAWTFAGSGTFVYSVARPSRIIVTSPIRPAAALYGFYGGTFDHLIRVLIDAQVTLESFASERAGWSECAYFVQLK